MTLARILIVAAVLIIVAGCGGGGGSQDASTTPSSPGEPSPGEPSPGEPSPGEPSPGEPSPGDPSPGEPPPGEPPPGEPPPEEPPPEEPPPEEPPPEEPPPADPPPGASVLQASGGTSTSGSGGTGGYTYVRSYGAVKVLKSGTVDASFPDPSFSPDYGDTPAIVNSDTTVLLDEDSNDGNLYAKSGNPNLYLGNGDSDTENDLAVTGLTVDAGATLVLVDQDYEGGFGTLYLTNDLVIYGAVTTDLTQTSSLYIEANVIDVESGGKITVSPTTMDSSAGEIYLGDGNGITKQIINRGTIEAKGLGSGNGGHLYFQTDDLVVNYGTLDASGGSSDTGSGGSGGELDIFVDYGDFYSSGTVRMNGGNGDSGGDTEANAGNFDEYSVYIETAYVDNTRGRNGDIIISGTWEANGGDGTAGSGGYGGYIYLETDALGAVTVNATMSVRGGDSSTAGFPGGNTYGIEIYSYLDPYGSGGFTDPASPGKIRIAGQYDLTGGDGDETGGSAGYLQIHSEGYNASNNIGSDVELVGFPQMNLNGGEGASGGSASSDAFRIYTYSAGNPAGAITNEAKIEARGGNATDAFSTGGMGGYVEMITGEPYDVTTVIDNSGNIDVSGGTGDPGGDGNYISMQAQHVTNSGDLTANGADGITAGGNGGNITLNSTVSPTTNTGNLSVNGGSGATLGSEGSIQIDVSGPI